MRSMQNATPLPQPEPCAICEQEPGTVDARWDHELARVCADCFRYETGEDPEAADDEEAR